MASMGTNTLTILRATSAGQFIEHVGEVRGDSAVTNHIVRASAARKFDETGATESRSVDKVLRLPKAQQT